MFVMHAPPLPVAVVPFLASVLLSAGPSAAQPPAPATASDDDTAALVDARHARSPTGDEWAMIRAALGLTSGAPLGYTSDEMANYGRDAFASRVVQNLFRDVRTLPRDTGRLSARLVESAERGDTAGAIRWAFLMLDVSSGRDIEPPPPQAGDQRHAPWGVPWLDANETLVGETPGPLSPEDALRLTLTRLDASPTKP